VPKKDLLLLAFGVLGVVAVVYVFRILVRLEREGRPGVIVKWIIGLVAFEGALWSQNATPLGPFHPQVGGQNFRLYDILIPLALLARLRVAGRPRRIGVPALALAGFLGWYTVCAAVGIVDHNGSANVIYQWKLLVYIGGAFALVSGVSAEELVGPDGLIRLVRPMAVAFAALDLLYFGGVTLNVTNKYIAIDQLHGVASDATTVSVALGGIVLAQLLRSKGPPPSKLTLAATAVLLLSAVTSGQRAVLLQLGGTLAVLLIGWLAPGRHRIRTTPTEAGIGVLTAAAALLATPVVKGQSPFSLKAIPFGSKIAGETFSNLGKVESAQERTNELHQVALLFPDRPFFGWGLGKTITYYQTGVYTYLTSDVTDDVYTDILLRTGIIGAALWSMAILSVVWGAVRAWRQQLDERVAALGLASAAGIVGVLAAGIGESIFEKYRIAVMLGMLLGMARVASTHPTDPDSTSGSWAGGSRRTTVPKSTSAPASLAPGRSRADRGRTRSS
jgi:O-antigen ligase